MFWNILLPLLFIGLMILLFPVSEQFQFNSDEGIQLIKALLTQEGYPLYAQVWSDQPPLLNALLVGVIKLVGYRVSAARLVVLLLSALLLWSNFHFLRLVAGKGMAVIGTLLVLLLPQYLELSVSVMVGLPAIAFSMLSLLALAGWHRQRKLAYLLLSALAFSLSIFTKLFTAFLGPIFLLGLLAGEFAAYRADKNLVRWVTPAFAWGVMFVLSTGILLVSLVGLNNIPQLILPHVAGREVNEFQTGRLTINHHLSARLPLMFAALLGAYFAIRQRQWLLLYPFAWLVSAYLLLLSHAPVWDHQQLLVTIPAAMLAPNLVRKGADHLRIAAGAIPKDLLSILMYLLILLTFFSVQLPPDITRTRFYVQPRKVPLIMSNEQARILNDVSNYSSQTNWIVTDLPMYAFLIGKPIPPNLAVITVKRVLTGNLTEDEIIRTIQQYRPEQVLFGRLPYEQVETYLQGEYNLARAELIDGVMTRHFVRKDLYPGP